MVKIFFAGYDYEIDNNIITIGSISFDVTKAEEFEKSGIMSNEGELARLYLDTLPIPERIVTDLQGNKITIPEKKGIDLSTATPEEIKTFLDDNSIEKSQSIISLYQRVLYLKSKEDFSITNKTEENLIKNDKRENLQFLAEVGFNDTLFLDKSKISKKRMIKL